MDEMNIFAGRNFDLLVSKSRRKEIFELLGYSIEDNGDIIDKETSKKIEGRNNEIININKSKRVAFVLGSHNFVRNVSEYSEILATEGKLNFSPEANVFSVN
jgi:hypothetical protein